jgi:hypothetical protein
MMMMLLRLIFDVDLYSSVLCYAFNVFKITIVLFHYCKFCDCDLGLRKKGASKQKAEEGSAVARDETVAVQRRHKHIRRILYVQVYQVEVVDNDPVYFQSSTTPNL